MKTRFSNYWFFLLICSVGLVQSQPNRGVPVQIQMANGQTAFSYDKSYALLIGNSDYGEGWDDLDGVEADLPEVQRVLEAQGFKVVVKKNLTGKGLKDALSDFQVEYGHQASRLLVWFGGHGYSLKLSYGDADNYMGYIVGTDAPDPKKDEAKFKQRSVSMDHVQGFLKETDKPRHILFVFDSCFSGAYFAVRAKDGDPPYIEEMTARVVRQVITSGSRDQEVPDRSIFRKYFVSGLQDRKADLNGDGYVTGMELGMYLKSNVTNESKKTQTPQYGTVRDVDLSQGDFVFKVRPEKPILGSLHLPAMMMAGQAQTYTAEAIGAQVEYLWDFGDGTQKSGSSVVHAYPRMGSYTLTLTIRSAGGILTERRTVVVKAADLPPPPPPSPQEDGISAIEAQAQAEATERERRSAWQTYQTNMAASYRRMEAVDVGGGSASVKQSGWEVFLRDYAAANPYSTEDESLRQKAAARRDYWQAYKSPPMLESLEIPPNIQAGASLAYSAKGTGEGLAYEWEMGDGKTYRGERITHTYREAGTYTITVTVVNAGGRIREERVVTVTPAQNLPVLTNLTLPGVIKVGDRQRYSATASGEGVEVFWDMGDGYTGKGAAITHAYTKAGTYKLVVTLRNAAGSTSADRTVVVAAADLPRLWTNSIGMQFVRIEKGSFLMGSPESDKEASGNEKPQHRVNITKDFYMGQYEVTQAQWEAVMGSNPSYFKGANRPVETVSWEKVQVFIQKLNAKEGTDTYRLPTEAEWEYAARAGSSTHYPWGDVIGRNKANCDGCGRRWGIKETTPVGSFAANAWGLYDMHGNVWEWVQDWYQRDYYKSSPSNDPSSLTKNPSTNRVLRGGSWLNSPQSLRSAYRNLLNPTNRNRLIGFRLSKTL